MLTINKGNYSSHDLNSAYGEGDKIWLDDGRVYLCKTDIAESSAIPLTDTDHWTELSPTYFSSTRETLVTSQGEKTVAEVNALIAAGLSGGETFHITDGGTLTIDGVDLAVAANEIIVWDVLSGGFVSMGVAG